MLPSGSTIIGRIEKTHGLQGMLIAHLDPSVQPNRLPRNPAHCWVEMGGRWTPFRCLEFQLRIPNGLLIKLENIYNPEQGQPLLHGALALENLKKTPQVGYSTNGIDWGFEPEALREATLMDSVLGPVGKIVRLHHRPPQDFLEFIVGTQSVYLPMVPEFVKNWHAATKQLDCHLPDGLLDLYLNPQSAAPEVQHQENHDKD